MKRTIKSLISVIALSAILQPAAQENTVTITSFTDEVKDANLASDDNSITEIRFFDTAGRLRQTLRKGFSPDGSDLVDFIDFDSLGRKCTEFDPMPVGGNNGHFVGRSQFSPSRAWARSFEYELSAQSRPVSVEGQHYGGGIAFYKYGFNNSASSDYKVFTLVPVPVPNCIRVDIVSASPGSYRFVEYKDEDGYRRITFFDPDGKTVLERVIASAGSQDTYYLYDDMDRLLGVLPPAVSSELSAQSSIFSNYGVPDTFGYWYKYDERNRTIGVKLPGIDWEYTVFDGENRPILRQDGNLRKKGLWTFFKYDELGRIVLEGTVEDSRSREILAGLWKDRAVKESFSGNQANYGYSDNSRLGQSEYRITAAYYYDRYEFISLDSLHLQNFWVGEQASTHGLMTGKYEAVLNVPGKGRTSIFVYDEKGRIIRSQQLDNLVDPFWTVLETGYDFSGQVLSEEHRYNGRLSLRYDYERDRMGRVTAVSLRYAGRSDAQPVQIPFSELSYDNYGRPTAKKILHDSLILNYSYDPDGGLFSIENPGRFSEQICRSSRVTTPYSLSRCKNGNINDIRISQLGNDYFWHFDYMDGNRLSRAAMYHSNNFNRPLGEEERFAYDNMGNITLLLRTHENRYAEQLDMVYKGNRLTKVSKNGDPNLEYDFQGYPDKADASTEMTYDPNGNMTADLDRGIVAIRYNLLNLPDTVQFENGNRIVYFYYAGGERAGAVTTTYSTPISVPLDSVYLGEDPHFDMWEHRHGNLFYKMGSPSRLLFDDGFFELAERHGGLISQIPYVFVRDHLGSVRLVCNGNTGEVVQSLEYLPSGVIFRSRNFDRQPYRFTGKELLSAHGLDWYDSGARMQEFHIPRFTTMDPLCEKYYSISPYAYCNNNPVKYVDPDGESWRLTYDRIEGGVIFTGYEWVDEDKSYDVDGNLLQGLYAQAIFFSDNKTFDKDNGYNIGSSTATVYLADGTTETYAACTNPSGSDYATVPEGTYHAKVGMHKGAYTALRMEDTDGSGRIELGYENPAYTDGRTYAAGINIHKPGRDNLTGLTVKKMPISAGCLLIDINSWDRFIGHFEAEDQKNNTVSVTVSRSLSEPVNVNRLPAFNFILNGTRESFFSRIKNRKL